MSTQLEVPRTITDPVHAITYRVGKMLGKGGFASVYEVEDLNNGVALACKVTSRASLQRKKYYDKFVSEVKIHKGLNHPNIVKVTNVFKDNLNYYIVMEKCSAGTLTDLVRRRKHLTEAESRFFTLKMLGALRYLHEMLIIHRDLKTSNIFLTSSFDVKLGDFGLAVQCASADELHWTMCGTPNFLPSEVIYSHITRRRGSGRDPDQNIDAEAEALCARYLPAHAGNGHSFASDLWSMGCLVYSLIYGRPPFESSDICSTYKRIIKCDYSFPTSIKVSKDFKDFISKLLCTDPVKRMTIEDALKHPWLDTTKYPVPALLPNTIRDTPYDPPAGAQLRGPYPQPGPQLVQDVGELNRYGFSDRKWPTTTPPVYIISWVDYSNRYGFAYQFSNGSIGVLFNDESLAVLSPNCKIIDYRESPAVRSDMEFVRCLYEEGKEYVPEKKFKLLSYFKEYLESRSIQPISADRRPTDDVEYAESIRSIPHERRTNKTSGSLTFPMTYIKKWKLYGDGTLSLLYNTKVFQVNFPDHTKVVVAHKTVSFINEFREVMAYPSENLKSPEFTFAELRERVERARRYYESIKAGSNPH